MQKRIVSFTMLNTNIFCSYKYEITFLLQLCKIIWYLRLMFYLWNTHVLSHPEHRSFRIMAFLKIRFYFNFETTSKCDEHLRSSSIFANIPKCPKWSMQNCVNLFFVWKDTTVETHAKIRALFWLSHKSKSSLCIKWVTAYHEYSGRYIRYTR